MKDIDSEVPSNRAGKQFRSNPGRYFHIMAEGWYIFTREGVQGPFYDKSHAENYLQQHIQSTHDQPDPSTSWRL
jgi:hypothetical protein